MNTQMLQGRVALITGGSKGIGFGAAERLIEEGAFVYITGRGKEALDKAVAPLARATRRPPIDRVGHAGLRITAIRENTDAAGTKRNGLIMVATFFEIGDEPAERVRAQIEAKAVWSK